MIRNYLYLFLRILQRHPFYFAVNLAGLTIGISCCMIIMLFVNHEYSYDNFHSKAARIYRLNYNFTSGETQLLSPSVPVFVGPEVKRRFPEVEDATRLYKEWTARTIRVDDKIIDERGFCWADSNFFRFFDFKTKLGDVTKALSHPGLLIITESMAKKYFGDENPIGKLVNSNNNRDYEVAAVIEDIPANSHFTFNFLTSLYSIKNLDESISWNNPNYTTFILLKEGSSLTGLSAKIEDWVNPPGIKEQTAHQNSLHLELELLREVHFNIKAGNFGNQLSITDPRYLIIFVAIAAAVLLIACANYVNLSTARASLRAKEVGMRKAIGASFGQLSFQFLAESFLMVLPAIILSVGLVKILLPLMNSLFGKEIPFEIFRSDFLLIVITGWIVLSLAAGFYPALLLSRFRPISVLRSKFTQTNSGLILRKGLVVFQFTITTVLVAATLGILFQLQFMQSKKLGLDKDHVLVITGNNEINKNIESFAHRLRNLSGVQDVAKTWRSPFQTVAGNGLTIGKAIDKNHEPLMVGAISADDHYITTLGIELLAGRNFSAAKTAGDSVAQEYVVNEAFLADNGLTTPDALGMEVTLGMLPRGTGRIVGVIKDFHFSSLHSKLAPVVLFQEPTFYSCLLVKIGPGAVAATLSQIEKEWKINSPMRPFNYSFLDTEYDAMYRTEQRVSLLVSVFSGVAIFVGCLGLLGLSSFTSSQRTKEICIRKVMGASITQIIRLLTMGYVRLLLVSFIIAIPTCSYILQGWLQGFAYKIEIGLTPYLIAVLIVVVAAWLTVSYQSLRAAVINPANALRNE